MASLLIGSDEFTLTTPQQGSQPAVYQLHDETTPVAHWRQVRVLVSTTGARIRVNGSLGIPVLNEVTGALETATVKVEFQMPSSWNGTKRDLVTASANAFATVMTTTADHLLPNPVTVDPLAG